MSQIPALLIFVLTRKRHNLVQNITLDIYKYITKSNLLEARAEMFLFDFFSFFLNFRGIGTIFLVYLLLILFISQQICFQKNKDWGMRADF